MTEDQIAQWKQAASNIQREVTALQGLFSSLDPNTAHGYDELSDAIGKLEDGAGELGHAVILAAYPPDEDD